MNLKNSVFVIGSFTTENSSGDVISVPSATFTAYSEDKFGGMFFNKPHDASKIKEEYSKQIFINYNKILSIKFKIISLHIGDIIDFITRYTGIKKLIMWLTKGNCGCEARRLKFNKWFFISIPVINLTDNKNYQNFYDVNPVLKRELKPGSLEELQIKKQKIFEQLYANSLASHEPMEITPKVEEKPTPAPPKKGGCGCGARKNLTKTTKVV